MDIWNKHKSPLGYYNNSNQIDSYGVNHIGFNTGDELNYQCFRQDKEQSMINDYNSQGITDNYPQFGTDFWGTAPDNNYGFGTSNIAPNIENMKQNQALHPANNINQTNNTVNYSLYGNDFSHEYIDRMINDNDFQMALKEYAIPNEGGYVNNLNDPGGETNMGISKRYHPNEDIKNLSRERANALLYKEIWNWNGINKLPREIKGVVFDYGIRTGPQNAIETTHRALGINPVGDIIGNTTLNNLKNIGYEDFLNRYKDLVKKQDKDNKNYQYFGKGWDSRTDKYHITY